MSLKEISVDKFNLNPVNAFAEGWAILTAGNKNSYNGMTVSWGATGEIWGKPAAFVFVRPQRHTLKFLETNDYFTISFFDGTHRDELAFFGSKSGRNYDKFNETRLVPQIDGDFVFCRDAKTVLLCKKAAKTEFVPENFYDKSIEDCYSEKDYHKIYVGEIAKILTNDE